MNKTESSSTNSERGRFFDGSTSTSTSATAIIPSLSLPLKNEENEPIPSSSSPAAAGRSSIGGVRVKKEEESDPGTYDDGSSSSRSSRDNGTASRRTGDGLFPEIQQQQGVQLDNVTHDGGSNRADSSSRETRDRFLSEQQGGQEEVEQEEKEEEEQEKESHNNTQKKKATTNWGLVDHGHRSSVPSWETVQPVFEKLGHTFYDNNKYFCRPNGDPRTNPNAKEGTDYFLSQIDYRKYLCAHGVDYIGTLEEDDDDDEQELELIAYWVRFYIFHGNFEPTNDEITIKFVRDLRLDDGWHKNKKIVYLKLLRQIGYTLNNNGIHNGYLLLADGEEKTYLSEEELWIHLGKHGLHSCTFDKFDTKEVQHALEMEIIRHCHGRYGSKMFFKSDVVATDNRSTVVVPNERSTAVVDNNNDGNGNGNGNGNGDINADMNEMKVSGSDEHGGEDGDDEDNGDDEDKDKDEDGLLQFLPQIGKQFCNSMNINSGEKLLELKSEELAEKYAAFREENKMSKLIGKGATRASIRHWKKIIREMRISETGNNDDDDLLQFLPDVVIQFLNSISINSGRELLESNATELAKKYASFREEKDMPKLKGKGIISSVSQWKRKILDASTGSRSKKILIRTKASRRRSVQQWKARNLEQKMNPKTKTNTKPLMKKRQGSSSSSSSSGPHKKAKTTNGYEIEAFCNRRINPTNHKEDFRIKWKGYPESENTWEPISNIDNQEDVKEWWQQELARRADKKFRKQQRDNATNQLGLSSFSEEDNDNDNDDDYVSNKATTESTLLSSDLISAPTLSPTRKIAATVEHRRRARFSLEGNISIRRATAIRITRGESFEVTLPPSCVRKCNNGEDALNSAAIQAVTDNSHIFIFDNLIKNAIREKKKVVRYEFLGQNPTSSQFKLLSMEDILLGDENTVLIKMSINDVKGHGKVTLGESLF